MRLYAELEGGSHIPHVGSSACFAADCSLRVQSPNQTCTPVTMAAVPAMDVGSADDGARITRDIPETLTGQVRFHSGTS